MYKSNSWIFYILLVIFCSCKSKVDKNEVTVSCDSIYQFNNGKNKTYYYLMTFQNNTQEDLILKKNKFLHQSRNTKDTLKSLEIILFNKKDTLKSPFVESNFMHSNYILYKKSKYKILYVKKEESDDLDRQILISSNGKIIDTILYKYTIVKLSKDMNDEDIKRLMNVNFK